MSKEGPKEERVVEKWGCGCQVYLRQVMIENTVGDEWIEEDKPCRALERLREQAEHEMALHTHAIVAYGANSNESNHTLTDWSETTTVIERHRNRMSTLTMLD